MKILHLTDFHYQKNNQQKEKVVTSIIETLSSKKIDIDLVLFTGDLVNSGTDYSDFEAAENLLIKQLIDRLNINKENVLFCPGNHDINRKEVHGAVEAYINSKINANSDLDHFHIKAQDVYNDSLRPSANYYKFINEFYAGSNSENVIKDLYTIHYRTINNRDVGIVSLNSAWISAIDEKRSGKNDKGNLLIPNSLLSEIKDQLIKRKLDIKIVMIHHPLYFLKEYNQYEIENGIHNNYDMLFSGHVHKISSISRFSGINGIFEHTAKASLSSEEILGCSIVEIDEVEENKIRVSELTIINDDLQCHISQPVIYTIPSGTEKVEMISFRKKLHEKIEIEKENANSLLLNENDNENDFLTLYRTPILKKESEDSLESKNLPVISIEDILLSKKNYIVLGKDKCGKTSLLRKIQLDCLINYSRNAKIPFYLDCKEQNSLNSAEDLKRLIRSYFGINKLKTEQILSSNSFILLIDNYSPHTTISHVIDQFFHEYGNINYIATTEYNLSMRIELFGFGNTNNDKLYNYDLRRQDIIAYTDKRLGTHRRKNEIQDKIIKLCKQLELPLNYWTVSLLLLIYNKSTDSYSKNLFSILDVCVDEIFGKKQLAVLGSKISFEQLKNIGARLAKYLFNTHVETVYSAPYSTILQFIEKEIKGMLRVSANPKSILDFFIDCGMLKYKSDSSLVFRLNGFFEYFLAYQMTKDSKFKNEILSNERKYLAFRNQLEVYSGFRRDDSELMKTVYSKTKNKIDIIFSQYSGSIDDELESKVVVPQEIEKYSRDVSIKRSLSTFEKAELEDVVDELNINSEVHTIREMDPNDGSSEVIERYLSILARVFKNLDEVDESQSYISEILNYILDSYCYFGFYIIDELSSVTKKEIANEVQIDIENLREFDLLKFISGFSPVISQTWLSDSISHSSLEKVIIDEISKIETDKNRNEFKLFNLYFLLLDIDLKTNKSYIEKALTNIRIPVLKYAVYIKLNFYLIFKSGSDKHFQGILSNYVQQAQLNLDNKTNLDSIQKDLQDKRSLSRKRGNQD